MKKILVVANDFPYPPVHGAALDIWTRLLTLKQMGFAVDLLASVREMPGEQDLVVVREVVDELWTVPRERGLRAALSWKPFQIRSRAALADISLDRKYDAVILEAEHVAAFLNNPAAKGPTLFLRIHNDESRYFRALSKGNVGSKAKLFYFLESLKFSVQSSRIRKASDALWFISDFERAAHVAKNPIDDARSFFLPPHVAPAKMKPFHAAGNHVLFVGTLTIPHNADAIGWYIEYIHPLLKDVEGYRLIVAGHTGGQLIENLRRAVARHSNITLIEDPPDLTSLYEESTVFVNPVPRGAGLKLKTIHALQAGVPVVTTSIGIEGTGLRDREHVLVTDEAHDFALAVRQLMENHELAMTLVTAAQAFLAGNYDSETKLQSLLGFPATDRT
jgi:glycosyltransferase involved in cell wall biosynthesis